MYFAMGSAIDLSLSDLRAGAFKYHDLQPKNYEFDENIIKLSERGIYVAAGQPGYIERGIAYKMPSCLEIDIDQVPLGQYIERHREFITCVVNAELYHELLRLKCVVFGRRADKAANRIIFDNIDNIHDIPQIVNLPDDIVHMNDSTVQINLSHYDAGSQRFLYNNLNLTPIIPGHFIFPPGTYLVTLINTEYGSNEFVAAVLDLTEPREQ
jgi:hypothetical protein